ncbi:MAG: hypothetical protein NC483_03695 [Ruminococcus sp.]|nr:hypothetical protein [Ruminococcus sp.]
MSLREDKSICELIEIPKINKEVLYPFRALDGSEHSSMKEAELANERFWRQIIPESTEFNTVAKGPALIEPEIQIKYYKNLLNHFSTNIVDYKPWANQYEIFMLRLESNKITPELALLLARVLLSTVVIRETSAEEVKYQQQINELLGKITDLEQLQGQTRN